MSQEKLVLRAQLDASRVPEVTHGGSLRVPVSNKHRAEWSLVDYLFAEERSPAWNGPGGDGTESTAGR
jgi:hypothetical protein